MTSLADSENNCAERGIVEPRVRRCAHTTRIATAFIVGTEESIFCAHVEWPFHDISTFFAYNKVFMLLIINIFTLNTVIAFMGLSYTIRERGPFGIPGKVSRTM
jgi:hypothetical protein